MDPAAADFYEEDGKDLDFYDFEPLPTLPEDEVSPRPALGPPPFRTEGFAESPQAPCPRARSWQQGDTKALLTSGTSLQRFPPAGTGPGDATWDSSGWAVAEEVGALRGWAPDYRCWGDERGGRLAAGPEHCIPPCGDPRRSAEGAGSRAQSGQTAQELGAGEASMTEG